MRTFEDKELVIALFCSLMQKVGMTEVRISKEDVQSLPEGGFLREVYDSKTRAYTFTLRF